METGLHQQPAGVPAAEHPGVPGARRRVHRAGAEGLHPADQPHGVRGAGAHRPG
ncbi:MAG: hypothetical protein MZU95_13500 [Desulfomicrobium escambiense]|nr:hypothetical protein [Desulfomicrobium escambiense]